MAIVSLDLGMDDRWVHTIRVLKSDQKVFRHASKSLLGLTGSVLCEVHCYKTIYTKKSDRVCCSSRVHFIHRASQADHSSPRGGALPHKILAPFVAVSLSHRRLQQNECIIQIGKLLQTLMSQELKLQTLVQRKAFVPL